MKTKRLWVVVLMVLVVAEGAALGLLAAREYWRGRVEGTPVVRGRAVADKLGCFGCHGAGGTAPIPNPGAMGNQVPMWTGGTWMMYNSSAADVRAWVLDGHPPDRQPDSGALIPMPAYRGEVSDGDVDDLVAYVLAVSQFGRPEGPAAAGRNVANRFGCFGCHGPEGRGLVENPLSFKGYIPAWDGEDYLELVRDVDEFRQWVTNGISDRFRDNPAARAFVDRQIVPMPPFGDLISDEEIDQLYAYVQWIRANPR